MIASVNVVGLVILLVGLVASALHFATGKGPAIIGDIVFYVVGFWTICIGATRAVKAVRLGWALKAARLMIISGALLGLFGMYLLLDHPWEQRLLLGFWPLASVIFLLEFPIGTRSMAEKPLGIALLPDYEGAQKVSGILYPTNNLAPVLARPFRRSGEPTINRGAGNTSLR